MTNVASITVQWQKEPKLILKLYQDERPGYIKIDNQTFNAAELIAAIEKEVK